MKNQPLQRSITVDVITKAKTTEIVIERTDYLKVRLHATPERGRANDELVKFLSQHFKTPKSNITIIKGLTSKHKLLIIVST